MLKRCFDLVVCAIALIILLPVAVVIAIVIRIRLGSPILFTQDRPGKDGRIFKMVKFRSMTDARNSGGQLLPDAERLPPFGRWLRASSLDELPELWNVLRGDMSMVGPRPLLVQYLPLYSREQSRRHEVRPGLTGWAQVNGRNALSWQEKFALDVWYVDNRSFVLDLRIMVQTVLLVLRRNGVSAAGEATMPAFTGND